MDMLAGFGLGSKKTSEAGVWVEDAEVQGCLVCKCSFTLLNRKHHCRQCGKVVCDACSQNRKFLESSRTGAPKRVCVQCFQRSALADEEEARKSLSAVTLAETAAAEATAIRRTASVRLPDVPMEEAVGALKDHPFEGQWDFNIVFMQVDLGRPGGDASTPASALSTFAARGAKTGAKPPRVEPVREGSKALISLQLKTKGVAYFQGECGDFGQFGQDGKVTGAVQRSNGKVSATIQMVSRTAASAITTSFNFVGFVNKEGVYSGTFSACEISKAAGSCSGAFKARRVDSADDEGGAGGGGAAEAAASPAAAAPAAKPSKASKAAAAVEEPAPAPAPATEEAPTSEEETEEARKARRKKEKEKAKRRAEREAARAAAAEEEAAAAGGGAAE